MFESGVNGIPYTTYSRQLHFVELAKYSHKDNRFSDFYRQPQLLENKLKEFHSLRNFVPAQVKIIIQKVLDEFSMTNLYFCFTNAFYEQKNRISYILSASTFSQAIFL